MTKSMLKMLKTCDVNLQVIIATLVGLDLAKELDVEEQNILANLLNIVASVLAATSTMEVIQKIKEDPDKEKQDESEEELAHVPETVRVTPEAYDRLIAEQEEQRRQIEKLRQQVLALEAREKKD
jgi:hypothetical protein